MAYSFNRILGQFKDPPASHRTAPLWVWNDALTHDIIREQLTELKSHGFGGAFIHPRPGLVTEYLSTDWFAQWAYALTLAKELGLKLYIYDENSYPSGFGGGHVSSRLPDCRCGGAAYRIITSEQCANLKPEALPWLVSDDTLKAYTCRTDDGITTLLADISMVPGSQWERYQTDIMVVSYQKGQSTPWLAGFSYVDILRPEVTRCFLDTIYEAYHERFGDDFGTVIPAIFTDEPSIAGSRIYAMHAGGDLPFSHWLAYEFQNRHGYSLLDHLPAILTDVRGDFFLHSPAKVRYDYYCTLRELWTKNFIQPVAQWCREHNIALTGHFMEHLWPHAAGGCVSPSVMENYEYQQWPGIDLLLCQVLREKPSDLLLVSLLEVKSIANQLGKERVLCEAFGAGGWDSTLMDYKRMADWLMVHGVNFICEHLTFCTITGARKMDHPQSFDWRQPWWDEYTLLNDYLARVCWMLSQGSTRQRILVIHPTTTGYLVARENERGNLMRNDPPTHPDMRSYLDLLQHLTDLQWDFDLGDEGVITRHGTVKGPHLSVGRQTYDLVIMSGDMKNITSPVLSLLQDYLNRGGRIVCHGEPGNYLDGEENPAALDSLIAHRNVSVVEHFTDIQEFIESSLDSRITCSRPFPRGVAHMRREMADGSLLYFIVNHSMAPFTADWAFNGKGVRRMDAWTGAVNTVHGRTKEDGRIEIPISLNRNDALLLLVDQDDLRDAVPSAREENHTAQTVDLHPVSIEPEDDNMLPLDYCDLHIDGKWYNQISALSACALAFKSRGFLQNPWDSSVQYRDSLLRRDNYPPGSGFTVNYHFRTEVSFQTDRCRAVVEKAHLYDIAINGHPITPLKDDTCLDHHNGVLDLLPFLRSGDNTLTLTTDRFSIFMEVAPAFLRGNFRVTDQDGRWVITAGRAPFTLGPWDRQGYPFYAGAFLYRYRYTLPAGRSADGAAGCLQVPTPEFSGTACSLRLGEITKGLFLSASGITIPEESMPQQDGELTFRVCGSLKNLLGPHHDPRRPRAMAWPHMWRATPPLNQPQAGDYDLIAYGLLRDPEMIALRRK